MGTACAHFERSLLTEYSQYCQPKRYTNHLGLVPQCSIFIQGTIYLQRVSHSHGFESWKVGQLSELWKRSFPWKKQTNANDLFFQLKLSAGHPGLHTFLLNA